MLIQDGKDFFNQLAERKDDAVRVGKVHEKIAPPERQKNKAYPCSDYENCAECRQNKCGWCKKQGWCVEDMPGICDGKDDHIGKASGILSCPAIATADDGNHDEKIQKKGLVHDHPLDNLKQEE